MNIGVSEMCISSPFPDRRVSARFDVSTFSHHIRRIFFVGTSKKMIRTNTRPIIASMADTKTVWNFTVRQSIGNTVCGFRSLTPTSATYSTVSLFINEGSPKPTTGRFFYFRPKSLFKCLHRTLLPYGGRYVY